MKVYWIRHDFEKDKSEIVNKSVEIIVTFVSM